MERQAGEKEVGATSPSNENGEPLRTDEMSVACFLWFRGHEILNIEWTGSRASWVFEPAAQQDAELLKRGQARVDPLAYFVSMTEFKKMVYKSKPG